MASYLVTGCAGFIGSNLVDRLLQDGHYVIGIDNFSTGQEKFLEAAHQSNKFKLIQMDILDLAAVKEVVRDIDAVFHLAANADVRFGIDHTRRDLEQNTIATYNILEAMRINGVKKILFSSTGSVYGEAKIIPTREDAPFPIQTSLYGASKLAGESLISAFSEAFQIQAWIFRFVSILGERYTHGHVFDFYKSLMQDSSSLLVLGNGKQRKSYLYVGDCINAIIHSLNYSNNSINIFNLGVNGYCEVNDSIGWICNELGISPVLKYTGGERGWVGDNPFIYLDTAKISNIGWKPSLTIEEGVRKTVQYLKSNEWVFAERS